LKKPNRRATYLVSFSEGILMSRRIALIVSLLFIFLLVGFLVTFIQKLRISAHLRASENNLRQLAMYSAHLAYLDSDPSKTPTEIPAATLYLPGTPPENRLSWIVTVIPGLDGTKNPVEELLTQIDLTKPWSAERNQNAGRTKLNVVICPENTPQTPRNSPALTCYVGIAGIGTDAATLTIPQNGPVPERAGAFRYDAPTPFEKITDGLSQTLLIGETADDPGPWLRGGPATARGFDDTQNAKPLIGTGGQFGGFFPNGANYAMCDGSVRFITTQVTPSVLMNLATIAGGTRESFAE
jgi:prepilin-type processing-associated H-X9-DG protein